MSTLDIQEIRKGLVVFLSPGILQAEGAKWFPPSGSPIEGDHYFLCIEVTENETYWVPLSSKSGENRISVPFSQKRGHNAWVSTPTFALAGQYWSVTRAVIAKAASVAEADSEPKNRNCVLPKLTDEIAVAASKAPLF